MPPTRPWSRMAAEPQAIVHAALDRLAGGQRALGIALSGGGDSTALMHLAAEWARPRGIVLRAATVDHGLRPGSAAEAEEAGRAARRLGIAHEVLRWTGPGGGNLMAQARAARLELLAAWAGQQGIGAVALGHTRDDQAETVLMRMLRGAGVDGLSGMAPARRSHGILWLRPLLATGRAELRDLLRQRGATWTDDPTNDDPRYDRARLRQIMAALDLPAEALARSADNLRAARVALYHAAREVARGFAADRGTLCLPRQAFASAPAELQRRVIVAGLQWVAGAEHPPRHDAIAAVLGSLAQDRQATLAGVIVSPVASAAGGLIRLTREPAAAAKAPVVTGDPAIWDRRWRLTGLPAGARVTTLPPGELPRFDWRAAGLTRAEAAASPAVCLPDGTWHAPVIEPGQGIGAVPLRGANDFLCPESH
ncbi:tRNA lysidine(34) synthetase TilS [uncultured Paracoccus sp.]|uniref:tRNA lysidine(34) synthetase TilS n=1 Tax=uncultured Paracoccus sp. TaxID=189685 RepID=UPI00262896BC|nr:tRNA lysidine(34) synthetase TilS [uncultured Paracoccus sp.]